MTTLQIVFCAATLAVSISCCAMSAAARGGGRAGGDSGRDGLAFAALFVAYGVVGPATWLGALTWAGAWALPYLAILAARALGRTLGGRRSAPS